ncbi:MAG: T9SS type A sorting domain-containing protein [Bacteroidetes bacterium]|nr:MAG: T9SS type A sorting domain-containing protein [Bacteroidota bacterium]
MKKLVLIAMLIAMTLPVSAQLAAGTYNVGTGQTYTTIANAITALNSNGVSGHVVFELMDETYAETGASLLINVTSNAPTASSTVTFRPATGVTPEITITGCTSTAGANQYAGFTISNTSYIIIDGSNNGSSTRDLTFIMNDGTNGRDGIVMYGNCDNVQVKNLKVKYLLAGHTTTGRGIYANGQSTGACDNLTIENCEIGENSGTLVGPHHGIGFTGSSGSAIYCTGGTISNNLIYANIRGINLFWHNGSSSTFNCYGNTISLMNPASGNVTWGILHQNYAGTSNFYANRINSITQKSTTTSGMYGFGTLNGTASSVTNLYNNFLGGAFDHTSTGVPASIDVISFQDAPASVVVRVYHNTVVMNAMTKTASSRMTCMRFNPVSGSTFDIKNNIFINEKDNAVAYALHFGGTTTTFTSNYNNIYKSGSSANIGYSSSTARADLSAWNTATSQDAQSKSKAVTFTSATNFKLIAPSNGDVDLIGTPIAMVTTDFEEDVRSATFPYMGADEGSIALPVELTSFTAAAKGRGVELTWKTAGETDNKGFEIERKSGGAWVNIGFVPGHGTSSTPRTYSFVDASASGTLSYRLKQVDNDGSFSYSNEVEVLVGPAVSGYELTQNYPNPFNPSTTIRFAVPVSGPASVRVYDITGREVAVLFDGTAQAGERYSLQFNAAGLSSGIYFYTLQSASYREVRKMQFLK